MADADAPARSPVTRGVRWLSTIPETLGVCALLCAVYGLELLVWASAGLGAVDYWFVADTVPSPGWVLSPLAHSPGDPLHLVSNLAVLAVFGGMTERRLPARTYLGFLAVASVGGVAGQVFWYAVAPATTATPGTLGASAVALAAASFAVVDGLRHRTRTGRWRGETTWLWTLSGGLILGRRLALDLVVGVPEVGRYGHLWGVLFGVAYALTRRHRRREAVTAASRR